MNSNISFTPPHLDPLISVIIPCYNAATFLPNCMKCLEVQTIGIEHLELIFVDDASSDQGATWEMILAFEAKYPNQVIAIQHEENKGQAGARNTGLLYTRGVYVGFMDQDDFIEPTFHQTMYEKATEYDCDMVQCGYVETYPDGRIRTHAPKEVFFNYEKSIMDGGSTWPTIWGVTVWNKLFRRSLMTESAAIFPVGLRLEDYYFNERIRPFISSIYCIEQTLYHWQRISGSISTSTSLNCLADFIIIGEAVIAHYQSLGFFNRCLREIEWDLLQFYAGEISGWFAGSPLNYYHLYCLLSNSVKKHFPDFESNPAFVALADDSFVKQLIAILNQNYTQEQFQVVATAFRNTISKAINAG
ncbi:hypothetical protein FACS1894111_03090 [Clostridia bacterium]|nr:hypothetical protein FACS1894111_03090 [Clostridia bacterium]